MTPDGRFVAFVQNERNGNTNDSSIRLWDRQTCTNVLVCADHSGAWPTNTTSHTSPPSVSMAGNVTFVSDATNLTGNFIYETNFTKTTISKFLHIYRRDLQASTTTLVDADTNGAGSIDQFGTIPSLSSDGNVVAFSCYDGGLVGGDTNGALDVFLWTAATDTNTLISCRNPLALSASGNSPSTVGQISLDGDGGVAAFASFAADLVTNDFNQDSDVFVRDLVGGDTLLVSVGLDGNSGSGGSYSPVISSDGRYVVFVSTATNLVAGDINLGSDVFRRDLVTRTTQIVSVNSNNVSLGNGGCSSPVISQDGRYVAFICQTNVQTSQLALFWRDLNSGLTRLISANATNRPISISNDGQRVAYLDNTPPTFGLGCQFPLANIYATLGVSSAAISPAGNRVFYSSTNFLYFRDLSGTTNTPLYPSSVQITGPAQWSSDGRYLTFVTATNLVAADGNGTNDVYLCDLQTGTLTLVSINQSGTASANGPSDSPVLSADARYVAFRTYATDVAAGITSPPSLMVFNCLAGTNRLFATGTPGTGWTSWLARPSASVSGEKLAFQSWDSGLVTGDLNRVGDILADNVGLPALDSDGDGIPDWWMLQHFGHPTGQAGDLSRVQDDPDGDGLDNLQEFLAGTDPNSSSSVLALQRVAAIAGGNVSLNWNALPGKSYHAVYTDDLSHPNWQAVPNGMVMSSGPGQLTVQVAASQRYFRIQCGN